MLMLCVSVFGFQGRGSFVAHESALRRKVYSWLFRGNVMGVIDAITKHILRFSFDFGAARPLSSIRDLKNANSSA